MGKIFHFLSYNNAVPITLTLLTIGAGSAYAANNPEVFVEKTEKVISIDNTYIAHADLFNYSPTIQVVSVEEDEERFYITYELTTIALQDHVWRDVVETRTLEVAKSSLTGFRDLGVYVTKQLNEIISSEIKRLRETQVYEKRQITQKQVATEYGGLVGGFLSDEVTTVAGYVPLVVAPKEEVEEDTFAYPPENPPAQPIAVLPVEQPEDDVEIPEDTVEPDGDDGPTETSTEGEVAGAATSTPTTGSGAGSGGTGTGTSTPAVTNNKPVVTILGKNPARVALGASYTDLGATVSDDHDAEIVADLYLNGEAVSSISLDTSTVTTYHITYVATDSGGKSTSKTRLVEVYDPAAENTGGGTGSGGGSTGGGASGTSTPPATGGGTPVEEPTPTPTPTPEPEPETVEGSEGEETGETTPDTSEAPAEEELVSEPEPEPEPEAEPDPAPESAEDSSPASEEESE